MEKGKILKELIAALEFLMRKDKYVYDAARQSKSRSQEKRR